MIEQEKKLAQFFEIAKDTKEDTVENLEEAEPPKEVESGENVEKEEREKEVEAEESNSSKEQIYSTEKQCPPLWREPLIAFLLIVATMFSAYYLTIIMDEKTVATTTETVSTPTENFPILEQ